MYKIPRVGLVMKIISRGRRKWNLEFQSPQILGKGIWNFSCVIFASLIFDVGKTSHVTCFNE